MILLGSLRLPMEKMILDMQMDRRCHSMVGQKDILSREQAKFPAAILSLWEVGMKDQCVGKEGLLYVKDIITCNFQFSFRHLSGDVCKCTRIPSM